MSPRIAALPGILAPQSEGDLGRQVAAYLDLLASAHPGFSWARRNSGKIKTRHGSWVFLGDLGTPDYSGHLPGGRAWYVELKKPGAKPTNARDKERWAAQEKFISDAAAVGCLAFRATSLEQVASRLAREMDH